MRVKAITNIQKITQSMKMISAAKYARAERELRPARSYGVGAKGLQMFQYIYCGRSVISAEQCTLIVEFVIH